ncbi:AcrR family transcriptional regulator [Paraburkholderia sp. 35.1]
MAEKGMEGVAINEITEAADVGFGSFNNHFESKEAIYATLVDNVFEEFANMLDRLASGLSDPAEVISVSVRHTVMRARVGVIVRIVQNMAVSAKAANTSITCATCRGAC